MYDDYPFFKDFRTHIPNCFPTFDMGKHMRDLLAFPKVRFRNVNHINYLPEWVREGCKECGAQFVEVREGYVCENGCGKVHAHAVESEGNWADCRGPVKYHLPKSQQIECKPIDKIATAWRKLV